MSWHVEVDRAVVKFLSRIPQKDASRLSEVLDDFETDPLIGDITKLSGETNGWRRRVGSYRIFFELFAEKRVVLVHEIKRRSSHTY